MNRSQTTKSYHHGDLRQAIMLSARALIAEKGLDALSIRQVAKGAGVSPGAPYHHFKDKTELITALAQESLERLEQTSVEAIKDLENPQEKLETLGLTYIYFALEHPNEFKLMFGDGPEALFARADPSQAHVFRVLLTVVSELGLSEDKVLETSIKAWSLVHGLATLLQGPLKPLTQDSKYMNELLKNILKSI